MKRSKHHRQHRLFHRNAKARRVYIESAQIVAWTMALGTIYALVSGALGLRIIGFMTVVAVPLWVVTVLLIGSVRAVSEVRGETAQERALAKAWNK